MVFGQIGPFIFIEYQGTFAFFFSFWADCQSFVKQNTQDQKCNIYIRSQNKCYGSWDTFIIRLRVKNNGRQEKRVISTLKEWFVLILMIVYFIKRVLCSPEGSRSSMWKRVWSFSNHCIQKLCVQNCCQHVRFHLYISWQFGSVFMKQQLD